MAGDDQNLTLDPRERSNASVLIVESDTTQRNNLRTAVKSLGYGTISDVPNHVAALDRIKDRRYTYVFFDSKATNMTPDDMLRKILEEDRETICIPTSFEPRVDDVFELFVIGARGFLVKPFTMDSVEDAIVWATKGEPIADAVLHATDRNEALVAVMMMAQDKVATLMRQAKKFETAERDVPRAKVRFEHAAELAKTFCKGNDDDLVNAILEFCIDRGKGPATKLGRLRKRLRSNRKDTTAEAES